MTAILSAVHLRERVANRGGRVEGNVIRGVSVLRSISANRRRYTAEAMRQAVASGVYRDGTPVFDNHATGRGPRKPSELVGRLYNARFVTERGAPVIRADLKVVRANALGAALLEAAEDGGGMYALSHAIDAESHREGDTLVITRIVAVESVDVVVNAATNTGLFEQRMSLTEVLKMFPSLAELREWHQRLREQTGRGRQLLGEAVAALAADGEHDLAAKVLKLLKVNAGGPDLPADDDAMTGQLELPGDVEEDGAEVVSTGTKLKPSVGGLAARGQSSPQESRQHRRGTLREVPQSLAALRAWAKRN